MVSASDEQPIVRVHAPAPISPRVLPGSVIVRCEMHATVQRRCYEAVLYDRQRLYLGRPNAQVAGADVLPFGVRGRKDAPWEGLGHVSAIAALIRADATTAEVLVTNLSRNHRVAIHMAGEVDQILDRTKLGDQHRRRPATAALREGSSRVDVVAAPRTASVWVDVMLDAAVAWRRLLPAADVGAGATVKPPARAKLRKEEITLLVPDSKEAKEAWRNRRTAFTVALARTGEGRALLRELLESTAARQRLAGKEGEKLRQSALAHLQRAESEAAVGGSAREPGPFFVAVDVARGVTTMADRRSGYRDLEHLWHLLHQLDVKKGVAVTSEVEAGYPGGSGLAHADLLEMVQRYLDIDVAAMQEHLTVNELGVPIRGSRGPGVPFER